MIDHHRAYTDPKSKSHLEINLDIMRENLLLIVRNPRKTCDFSGERRFLLPVALMIVQKMVN
jgi:hypothetical protein